MVHASAKLFQQSSVGNEAQFRANDWAMFVGVSLIWGSSFLLIAFALEDLTPAMITLGRVGLGALTLWGLRVTRRPNSLGAQPSDDGHRPTRIEPQDRLAVGLLGVLWVAVPFTLFPLAQQWVNSAVTGLINGATPLMAAVVSTVFVRKWPTLRQSKALVVGLVGVGLISLGSAAEGGAELTGVLLLIAATVCYGFALNIAPPLQAKYGALVTMSNTLLVATLLVAPLAFVSIADNEWSLGAVLAVVALGAVGTGIAYRIMSALVGSVGAIRASFITYLIPVVALILGVTIRADEVSNLALAGMILTLCGAALASRR